MTRQSFCRIHGIVGSSANLRDGEMKVGNTTNLLLTYFLRYWVIWQISNSCRISKIVGNTKSIFLIGLQVDSNCPIRVARFMKKGVDIKKRRWI